MILLIAVIVGLILGVMRAAIQGRPFVPPPLQRIWLALLAFLPQYLVFFLPATARLGSREVAAVTLVGSQSLLLIFTWWNRRYGGMRWMGAGLVLNLLVILANGGLMPISPQTIARLYPVDSARSWQTGDRLGGSKNIVLPIDQTRFEWLGDRILFPEWIPYRVAFSFGDILIAIGAFWFLWKDSTQRHIANNDSNNDVAINDHSQIL